MMHKTTAATAVTGLAVAMAAGTAAYMAMGHNKRGRTGKQLKRNANKAIRTLGSVLNSVEGMLR